MVLKMVGMLLFLFIIFFEKLYYALGWWDAVSFLVVFMGSVFVWLIYFFLKRKWDFFAKNVSVFLGIAYSFIWGINLMFFGHKSLIFPLAIIPMGYGFILGVISELIYRRYTNADQTN